MPQWIYHHIYFGFSGFNIYVNRSTDNTLAILEKLKSYYPCINYRNVDWMDKYFNKNIPFALLQRGSYLDDYYNTSIDDFDYIMYIDIDEFYLPINFTDQISDCVWKLGNPDCIYFNWYMIDGVNEYIMPLFANKFFYGQYQPYTKYALRTGLKPDRTNIHYPVIPYVEDARICNCETHIANRANRDTLLSVQFSSTKEYLLLHDANRVPQNIYSKMINGPSMYSGGISEFKKSNARRPLPRLMCSKGSVLIENKIKSNYYTGFKKLVEELDLYEDIKRYRIYENLKMMDCMRYLSDYPDEEYVKRVERCNGGIKAQHSAAFERLCALDASYGAYSSAAFARPENLATEDKKQTIANFTAAIQLYPYAKAPNSAPLFLRGLISYLLEAGDFDTAWMMLQDGSLLSRRVFGTDWAMPLFARAYERQGKYGQALELYEKMQHSYEPFVFEAMVRLRHYCSMTEDKS